MKLLIVSPYFAPAWGFGGVPKMTYEIGKRMAKNGHEVHAYVTDALDVDHRVKKKRENIEGIKVKRFPNISNKLASGYKLFFPRGFAAYFKKNVKKFDVIFLSDFRSYQNAYVAHYANKYNIPVVIAGYGQIPRGGGIKKPLKVIFDYFWGYKLLRNAYKCLAQTEHEARGYRKMGVANDKIEIMPLGIDLTEYKRLPIKNVFRVKHQISTSDKMILFLGRFHEYKCDDLLIKAFRDVKRDVANVKLVLAGRDDGYLPRLKELVEEYGLQKHVVFPGPLYGKDKFAALNDANIFCIVPSFYEETSVAALEALACGTPVVITKQCAIPHLDEYEAGITVKYCKKQVVTALEKLLSGYNLRTRMEKNAKKLIEEIYSWKKVMPRFAKLFREAAKTKKNKKK